MGASPRGARGKSCFRGCPAQEGEGPPPRGGAAPRRVPLAGVPWPAHPSRPHAPSSSPALPPLQDVGLGESQPLDAKLRKVCGGGGGGGGVVVVVDKGTGRR